MSRKKKVLIVTQRFEYGGLDFVAIRLQQALDKEKFECTYCVRNEKQDNRIEESLTSAGIKVIHQPKNESGYIKSYFYYRKLFKKEHFDIVHCHLPFYSGIVMAAAKKSGIKNTALLLFILVRRRSRKTIAGLKPGSASVRCLSSVQQYRCLCARNFCSA